MEDIPVEKAILTGVAHDRSEAKITVTGLDDKPGSGGQLFRAVADAEINIDMVLQNISKVGGPADRHHLHPAAQLGPLGVG